MHATDTSHWSLVCRADMSLLLLAGRMCSQHCTCSTSLCQQLQSEFRIYLISSEFSAHGTCTDGHLCIPWQARESSGQNAEPMRLPENIAHTRCACPALGPCPNCHACQEFRQAITLHTDLRTTELLLKCPPGCTLSIELRRFLLQLTVPLLLQRRVFPLQGLNGSLLCSAYTCALALFL